MAKLMGISNGVNRGFKTFKRSSKGVLLLACLLFTENIVLAQVDTSLNLVLNPSLEKYYKCSPNSNKDKFMAVGWYNPVFIYFPISRADYSPYSYYVFNSPCKWEEYRFFKPDNKIFTRSGDAGFANRGIYNYTPSPTISAEDKSFLAGTIKEKLVKNKYYYFSFFVKSLKESALRGNVGEVLPRNHSVLITFDSVYFNKSTTKYWLYKPQVSNSLDRSLVNTNKWTEIKGVFRANGGENRFIVGNFKRNFHNTLDTIKYADTPLYISHSMLYDDFTLAPYPYLGPDTCLANGDSMELSFPFIDLPAGNFRWKGNKYGHRLKVYKPGTYWVQYKMGTTTIRDSITIYGVDDPIETDWFAPKLVNCSDTAINLHLPQGAFDYTWSSGASTPSIRVDQQGIYSATWGMPNGCSYQSSTKIRYPKPTITHHFDTTYCLENRLGTGKTYEDVVSGDYDYVEWYKLLKRPDKYEMTPLMQIGNSFYLNPGNIGLHLARANMEGCYAYDTFDILFNDTGYVDLGDNRTVCLNDDGSILHAFTLGGDSNVTYKWSDGYEGISRTITESGTYKVESTNRQGCTFSDEVNLHYYSYSGISDVMTCHGDTIEIKVTEDLPYRTKNTHYWNKDNEQIYKYNYINEISITESGSYEFWGYLTDKDYKPYRLNCRFSMPFEALFDTVREVFITMDTTICNQKYFKLTLKEDLDSVLWSDGYKGKSRLVPQYHQGYQASAWRNGCVGDGTINIRWDNIPYSLVGDLTFCEGSATQVSIRADSNISVLWMDSLAQDTLTIHSAGQYYYYVYSKVCGVRDSVRTSYHPSQLQAPIFAAQERLCIGDSLQIGRGLYGLSWTLNGEEMSERTRFLKQEGSYTMDVWDHCDTFQAAFDLSFELCQSPVFVPTAFSPDQKGTVTNEKFQVVGPEMEYFSMQIFSRSGQKVFESDAIEAYWTGQLDGKDLPAAQYLAIIKYKVPHETEMRINQMITLIR